MSERATEYREWYHREAKKAKRLFLSMRSITVVAAAVVPVLVNLELDYGRVVATLLSLAVVVLVSLESVLHYRERWKNYRTTAEYLWREEHHFRTSTGPYRDVPAGEVFQAFVERVEGAIGAENAATLNTMTLLPEGSEEEKPTPPYGNG